MSVYLFFIRFILEIFSKEFYGCKEFSYIEVLSSHKDDETRQLQNETSGVDCCKKIRK